MFRFLITGRPRTRSAWLAAFISAHGVPCYHDLALSVVHRTAGWGVCDPAAVRYSDAAFADLFRDVPIVFIDREEAGCRKSFERWIGGPVADPLWQSGWAGGDELKARASAVLSLEPLSLDWVSRIFEGARLGQANADLFRVFQRLHIEQRLPKR